MPLPNGYSFQVPVEREVDALRFFYRFLTCGWLVAPECSAFSDSAGQSAMNANPLFGVTSTTFTKDLHCSDDLSCSRSDTLCGSIR